MAIWKTSSSWYISVHFELRLFGGAFQFHRAFEPLHSELKWVHCASTFPAILILSVPQPLFVPLDFLPTGAHVLVSDSLWALTGDSISDHLLLRRRSVELTLVPLPQVSLNPIFFVFAHCPSL